MEVYVAPLIPAMLELCAEIACCTSIGTAYVLICALRGSFFGTASAVTSTIVPLVTVTSTCTVP